MPPPGEQAVSIEAWEGYWRHTDEAAAHRAGGRHEPLLAQFWASLFIDLLVDGRPRRVLDMACGNGAALGYLFGALGAHAGSTAALSATGLDGSVAALKDLQRRMPWVNVVAADARFPPFPEWSFDIVISQFGVEYGGADAVLGAAPMVAPGGTLALVMHLKDGGIYRECAQNVRAIAPVMAMLPAARTAIAAAIELSHGNGSREEFQKFDREFAPTVKAVEQVFRECGTEVAGGFILRLYRDIGHIYRNAVGYVADDVVAWLDRMAGEIATYRARMQGMLDAALDEAQYNELHARLGGNGMVCRRHEKLGLGEAGQAAWVLVASRPAA